jgi:DDE superfamily endonuclease
VDTLVVSSFGTFVMGLFHGLFTTPSWQSFALLACGWALATDRHTITTYVWLTGATTVKHFSRFYVFLGCPLYQQRWHLWGAVIRLAAQFVPAGEVIRVSFDDTTKKKAGTHIEGLARYRNGAGSARQEYRTLRGVNFVLGIMHIPLTRWPGHSLSVPVGCELYRKEPQAQSLHVPYQTRSQLARAILDFVAEQVPGRAIRSLADGGYATKDYVRQLPKAAHVVGRFPINAKLSALPPVPTPKRRGAPRKKGALIGSPKTLGQTTTGWVPHPSEAGAELQAWCGLWHAVLPGRLVQVVVLRRQGKPAPPQPGHRKPPSPRSLVHHRSDVERGRDRARVWPPLGRGNYDPGQERLRRAGARPVSQAATPRRRQHVAFGPGGGTHAVVHCPCGSWHGGIAVPLPALVQTENGT